jgi:hypothetical protein
MGNGSTSLADLPAADNAWESISIGLRLEKRRFFVVR